MEKSYDPLIVEEKIYAKWLEKNAFKSGDTTKPPFCMVIPPPNVTGKLHLGHSLNTLIMDSIARYKRMCGYDVLFLPGTDHAGIATQAKVEKHLLDDGINKYDIGRDEFIKHSFAWKDKYHDIMLSQWKSIGLSLDYSKERFTLDAKSSESVLHAFIKLYNEGFIYQDSRIINWDTKLKTAISNVEVIYKESKSKMYYFKYYLKDSNEFLPVATTRPETMFGDQAVFVNPSDKRYQKYKNQYVINPANNELLPIIMDEYVDIKFGTGAMKCTPAHDPNDFILAKKYNLAFVNIMNTDGSIKVDNQYNGLDRYEVREKLVKELEDKNLVIKIEEHINQVGYSERSDTVIETLISKQWFVRMKELAKDVIKRQKGKDKTLFFPKRFEKVLFQWLNNIEDWCISRQMWWGHRIPVYYKGDEVYCGLTPGLGFVQDEDVLDTWFSSALWPFSTLNWPDSKDPLFQRYFPTDVLVTAYDIIFFWVARMMFSSLHFNKLLPFKHVVLTGLIRDSQGRKMNKSLGNGIDPIEVAKTYGADALHFYLLTASTPGFDMSYQSGAVEKNKNFINKLWNASRFIYLKKDEVNDYDRSIFDTYYHNRIVEILELTRKYYDSYEFGLLGEMLYNFIYDEFCGQYIEYAKSYEFTNYRYIFEELQTLLKILHPLLPFVTEEIYNQLLDNDVVLDYLEYPKVDRIEGNYEFVRELNNLIFVVRKYRSESDISYSKKINIDITDKRFIKYQSIIKQLLNVNKVSFEETTYSVKLVSFESIISLNVDEDRELTIKRLQDRLNALEKELLRSSSMLKNEKFLTNASKDKVEEEKKKEEKYKSEYNIVKNELDILLGGH